MCMLIKGQIRDSKTESTKIQVGSHLEEVNLPDDPWINRSSQSNWSERTGGRRDLHNATYTGKGKEPWDSWTPCLCCLWPTTDCLLTCSEAWHQEHTGYIAPLTLSIPLSTTEPHTRVQVQQWRKFTPPRTQLDHPTQVIQEVSARTLESKEEPWKLCCVFVFHFSFVSKKSHANNLDSDRVI